jgi:hypothetical protein
MRVQGKENGKNFAKKAHWNRMFLQGLLLFLSCQVVSEPCGTLFAAGFIYAMQSLFMRLCMACFPTEALLFARTG